jgi:membrane-associated phospholipid phosphatase
MIGIGGFIGLLFSLLKITHIYNELLFVLAVAVAGVVAYSRLLLQAHSQSQVYAGFLLGFIVSVVFLYLLPI